MSYAFLLLPLLVHMCAGHNQGVDCWALGILIYEMLSGYSPFADHAEGNQVTIYRNIVAGRYAFPSSLNDNVAKDLVRRLLVANASKVCVCVCVCGCVEVVV